MEKHRFVKAYSRPIDFLLEKAGPVIRYRLRREILGGLPEGEAEKLREKIADMPLLRLLQTYVKPDGYIGSGMHSWDNWRGTVLHETPLQDGECAARLLSYYRIPKEHPLVRDFVSAMRDEETLRREFSYIPPEIPRFENRFEGLNNGNCLAALLYTMQAMLGYGDDFDDLRAFQQTALQGFRRAAALSSLEEITTFQPEAKRRYNYPYIKADDYFPNVYTLAMLAYTKSWRNPENAGMLADAFNRINEVMKPDNNLHVRIKGKQVSPCFALVRPIRAFHPDRADHILYRRLLSEIAMLGVGERVQVIRESAARVREALERDGVLRMDFRQTHGNRLSPRSAAYPTAYGDVWLEADGRDENARLCDLTFWAVEFLFLVDTAAV